MRKWRQVVAVAACAFLAACSGGGGGGVPGGSDAFIYSHPVGLPDLDPAISFSNDSVVLSNCYETLTFYNNPGSEELIGPRLAESWEHNKTATKWTFHLVEGVSFSDGEPFNASAVKSSVERTKKIGLGASFIWDPVESIEVVDDYTVTFHLSSPAALDLIAASGYGAWMYSPKADEYGTEWFQEGHCAGTGPYDIKTYEPGSRLVMRKVEDYWRGWENGQFSTVVFEIDEEATIRQQKVEGGAAHFTYEVPPDNLDALRSNPALSVYTNPSFQQLLGLLNTKKAPLNDPRVRQALSYSFPYDTVINDLMNGDATPAHGPIPDGMWGHSEELFRYEQDLPKAKQLLDEAGVSDVTLLLTYSSGDLAEKQLAEVWKADAATIGVNIEIRPMTWESQWELARSGPAKAQDIFLFYWWPDVVSPYSFLHSMFETEDPGEELFNLGYYSNPEFDRMITEANKLSGSDRDASAEMFVEAQRILIEDAPAVFIYDVANTHVARSDVKGFVDNPAYPHVVFVYDLRH